MPLDLAGLEAEAHRNKQDDWSCFLNPDTLLTLIARIKTLEGALRKIQRFLEPLPKDRGFWLTPGLWSNENCSFREARQAIDAALTESEGA